jgi:exonuclease VII small subunit
MGAIVVDSLTASYWVGSKPKDYKGGLDLERALKAYEAAAAKGGIQIPSNLIPKVPQSKIGEIDGCIKDLTHAVAELQKGMASLKLVATALQAVRSAADKTGVELGKLAKGKGVDPQQYEAASTRASSIGMMAADALSRIS